MKKILVFDNYDSFTYNLVHYIEEIVGYKVDVYRNDQIPIEDVEKYDKILLSPGPGIPKDAGILIPLIQKYGSSKSILGVCLGHQAIAEAFGGSISNLSKVYHGVATPITITTDTEILFKDIPKNINVGRYHSWVVNDEDLPDCFTVTSRDEEGKIMGIHHNDFDVRGVQFHPESILTENGKKMMENWLKED
ncbi:anthranilate synthase component II [Plebeiibacterium sediminum]|uniref:Aminodeoxychorismate/anthranilate synthase component II n=1 Tax=Plebeiibacterium sediminum TaxID=2992112 RepID=A0AAE3SEJ8_9BACT|nr:aminodeoxychorismate/anthranilate synthase component II [Plebeiobacterium sediminum]MCW3786092.1 aminodeoxychorismate/anthranilate synthase component II [Plebeiobacterium sediminum]